MSFGFILRSEEEFKAFEEQVRSGIAQDSPNSIFHVVEENDFHLSLSSSIISINSYL